MGWFAERIEERKKHEDELLTDAFQDISRAVAQHKIGDGSFRTGRDEQDAISQLLHYFDVKERQVPERLKTLPEKLDYLLSASGIFYRVVRLEEGWHKDAMGVMMGTMKEDGAIITILPNAYGGFVYIDPHTGRKRRVNKKEEKIGRAHV